MGQEIAPKPEAILNKVLEEVEVGIRLNLKQQVNRRQIKEYEGYVTVCILHLKIGLKDVLICLV